MWSVIPPPPPGIEPLHCPPIYSPKFFSASLFPHNFLGLYWENLSRDPRSERVKGTQLLITQKTNAKLLPTYNRAATGLGPRVRIDAHAPASTPPPPPPLPECNGSIMEPHALCTLIYNLFILYTVYYFGFESSFHSFVFMTRLHNLSCKKSHVEHV